MKLNKILLAIPAFSSVVLPLTSCHKNNSDTIITIDETQKTQKSEVGYHVVGFELKASNPATVGDITFSIRNIKGTISKFNLYLTADPDNSTIFYLWILFDESVSGGQYCSFDIDFVVSKQYKSTITGLKAIYMDEHNVVPEEAFIIEGTTLNGFVEGYDTTDFDTIQIPSKVTEIKKGAFKDEITTEKHGSLTTLLLDHSLIINEDTFKGCNSFKVIDAKKVIATSATLTIKTDAFADWATKGEIVYANSTAIDTLDYALCDAGLNTGWFDLTKVRSIPASDLSIDGNKSVKANWTLDTMPNHLTKLCNTLDLSNMDITSIADNGFNSNLQTLLPQNITTLALPTKLTTIGQNAFKNCLCSKFIDPKTNEVVNYLTIPSTVTAINKNAFEGMINMNYIVLNEGLLTISENAFNTTGLYGINIPSTVATIGDNAFGTSNNMVSIDVTAFKKNEPAPSGWSLQAFSDLPDEGWISCDPKNAKNWADYFSNFVTIQSGSWQITDDVNLLQTYTPAQTPKAAAIYGDINTLMESFIDDLKENPLIMYDDLIWTTQKHLNASDYDMFNLKVNNLSSDEILGTITFMLSYRVKFKNNERTYIGYMYFANMDINTLSAYKAEYQTQFDLTFSNILAQKASTVEIYEADDQGTVIVDKYYKENTFPTSYSVENFGNVLNKIKLFKFDGSSKPTFDINSVYLKDCRVNG